MASNVSLKEFNTGRAKCFCCATCKTHIATPRNYIGLRDKNLKGGIIKSPVYNLISPKTDDGEVRDELRVKHAFCGDCRRHVGWYIVEVLNPSKEIVRGKFLLFWKRLRFWNLNGFNTLDVAPGTHRTDPSHGYEERRFEDMVITPVPLLTLAEADSVPDEELSRRANAWQSVVDVIMENAGKTIWW